MRVFCLNRGNDLQGIAVESLNSGVLAISNRHLLHRLGHVVDSSWHRKLLVLHNMPIVIAHVHFSRSIATTCILDTHHVAIMIHVGRPLLVKSVRPLLVPRSIVATLVIALELTLWKRLQELSNLVVKLISARDVLPVRALVVKLLEPLEAEFIFCFLILDVPEFFKLIVANLKLSAVDHAIVQKLKCLLSLIWSLETHKGICLFQLVKRE